MLEVPSAIVESESNYLINPAYQDFASVVIELPQPFTLDNAMTNRQSEELDRKIETGIKQAVSEALEEHRRMGRAVVVWKDGKVVTIPPSEIPTRNEEPDPESAQQMEAAVRVMSEDCDVLRKLAE